MKRVIGYIRVSTDKQDLQRQKVDIQKYCESNGYDIVKFISDKISGAKADRCGFNELKTMTNKDADMVIISELSRLSREDNIPSVFFEIETIRKNGLDLYILDSDTLLESGMDIDGMQTMLIVFKAVGNADERKKIAERMKSGKNAKMYINHYAFLGGQIPFGYKVIDNPLYNNSQKEGKQPKSILARNEDEIKILQMMYDKIIKGNTIYQLAKYLIKNDIKFSRKGMGKMGLRVGLSFMLHNRIYIGERKYNGEIFNIEPIIDKEIFDKALNKLLVNKKFVSVSKNKINPLKGLVYCSCGYAMYLRRYDKNNSFRCVRKRDDMKNVRCHNHGINYNIIFDAVMTQIKEVITTNKYKLKASEKEKDITNDINRYSKTISNKEDEIKALEETNENTKKRLLDVIDNEQLTKVYQTKFIDDDNKIKALKGEIKGLQKDILSLKDKLDNVQKYENMQLVENMDIDSLAELIHNIIDKLVWYGDKPNKGILEINYKNGMVTYLVINGKKKSYDMLQCPLPSTLNKSNCKVVLDKSKLNLSEIKNYGLTKDMPIKEIGYLDIKTLGKKLYSSNILGKNKYIMDIDNE
jgi:site-specific DNA recombinase